MSKPVMFRVTTKGERRALAILCASLVVDEIDVWSLYRDGNLIAQVYKDRAVLESVDEWRARNSLPKSSAAALDEAQAPTEARIQPQGDD